MIRHVTATIVVRIFLCRSSATLKSNAFLYDSTALDCSSSLDNNCLFCACNSFISSSCFLLYSSCFDTIDSLIVSCPVTRLSTLSDILSRTLVEYAVSSSLKSSSSETPMNLATLLSSSALGFDLFCSHLEIVRLVTPRNPAKSS